jgi:hypothetical protein
VNILTGTEDALTIKNHMRVAGAKAPYRLTGGQEETLSSGATTAFATYAGNLEQIPLTILFPAKTIL